MSTPNGPEEQDKRRKSRNADALDSDSDSDDEDAEAENSALAVGAPVVTPQSLAAAVAPGAVPPAFTPPPAYPPVPPPPPPLDELPHEDEVDDDIEHDKFLDELARKAEINADEEENKKAEEATKVASYLDSTHVVESSVVPVAAQPQPAITPNATSTVKQPQTSPPNPAVTPVRSAPPPRVPRGPAPPLPTTPRPYTNGEILYQHLITNQAGFNKFAALLLDQNINTILEGNQAKNSREDTKVQMNKMNEWANNILQYFPSELAANYRKQLPDITTKTGPEDNKRHLAELRSLAIALKRTVTENSKLNKWVVEVAPTQARVAPSVNVGDENEKQKQEIMLKALNQHFAQVNDEISKRGTAPDQDQLTFEKLIAINQMFRDESKRRQLTPQEVSDRHKWANKLVAALPTPYNKQIAEKVVKEPIAERDKRWEEYLALFEKQLEAHTALNAAVKAVYADMDKTYKNNRTALPSVSQGSVPNTPVSDFKSLDEDFKSHKKNGVERSGALPTSTPQYSTKNTENNTVLEKLTAFSDTPNESAERLIQNLIKAKFGFKTGSSDTLVKGFIDASEGRVGSESVQITPSSDGVNIKMTNVGDPSAILNAAYDAGMRDFKENNKNLAYAQITGLVNAVLQRPSDKLIHLDLSDSSKKTLIAHGPDGKALLEKLEQQNQSLKQQIPAADEGVVHAQPHKPTN